MASSNSALQQQAKFDLGISLILSFWEALSLAVQNQWGGPDSEDKRDGFAGAISDLFAEYPETDADDLEQVLLQFMGDEFEVAVEDGSEITVAAAIFQIKNEITRGDYSTIDSLWQKYKTKKGPVKAMRVGPSSDDGDSVDAETDDEDEDGDVDMADDTNTAPSRQARSKLEPEIDEDGFTKVVGRRR